jgi:hypothetical protein
VVSRTFASACLLVVVAGCVDPGGGRPSERRRTFSERRTFAAASLSEAEATERLRPLLAPGEVLGEVVVWPMPFTGQVLAVGVFRTPWNARVVGADASGNEVNFSVAKQLEVEGRLASVGKMSEALFNRQSGASDGELIDFEVVIVADVTPSQPPYDGTDLQVPIEEFRAHIEAEQVRIRNELSAAKAPLLEWLVDHDAEVEDHRGLPVLSVRGPAQLLRLERLHGDDVSALDMSSEPSQHLGYGAHASIREDSLTGGLCGGICLGGGAAIGIWEFDTFDQPGPLAIADGNGRLAGNQVTYQNTPLTCTTDDDCNVINIVDNKCVGGTCQGLHVSTTAAMLGMTGSHTYPVSEGVDTSQVTFTRAGINNIGRFVANHSVALNGLDFLLDSTFVTFINRSASAANGTTAAGINWAARARAITTTVASGNSGPGGAIASQDSWNALSVGMFSYFLWSDPSSQPLHFLSSFVNNSSHPGQERPHMVGPGANKAGSGSDIGLHHPDIQSTGSPGAMLSFDLNAQNLPIEAIGSSFAAPVVMSAIVQAQQYEGWFSNLYYPIVKKAIILAATTDGNADGNVLLGTEWTSGTGAQDGKDGAGQPDLSLAKQILDNNRYSYVNVTNSSFVSCGTGCREYTIKNFTVNGGHRIKAALVWNTCAATRTGSIVDPTDLDLVLVQPAWCLNALRQSVSLNNELEMIADDCLASSPVQGTYSARVRIKNGGTLPLCGSETNEPLAFAWSWQ